MLLPRLGALLIAASTAHAYRNTSPFFLISSDPLPSDAPLQSSQFAMNTMISDQLSQTLSQCDKTWYYIYEQEGTSASDLKSMLKLQERMRGADKRKVVEVPDSVAIVGSGWSHWVVEELEKACAAKGKRRNEGLWPEKEDNVYEILAIKQPPLPSDAKARAKVVKETDDAMANDVASILDGKTSGVLIYTSSPPPPPDRRIEGLPSEGRVYEMDEPYPEALHTDLKRDTDLPRRQTDDEDMQAGLPLFEKYQFLSPPIFMGLSVSILLLLILSVGVKAISGLDVSYMAFNKEMGPQAQKPKQQ